MAPPKQKVVKMSMQDFLGDESLGPSGGSWADEMEDYPPLTSESRLNTQRREYGGSSSNDRFSGYSRADTDTYPTRQQLPVPDKPPYTAHVGNLSFDATESEISEFFSGCDVLSVRLVRDREDRPKGFGYVEFSSREGLVSALDRNGSSLAGRNVRISVAEPPKDRGEDRTAGEWRRTGPLPPLERESGPPRRGSGYDRFGDRDHEDGYRRRQSSYDNSEGKMRDLGNWERKGPLPPPTPTGSEHGGRGRDGERDFRRRSPAPGTDSSRFRDRPHIERQPSAAEQDPQWRKPRAEPPHRSTPTSPVIPHTRPKLELKKRTEGAADTTTSPATASSDKPNPFGAAKPIDTFQREREIEEKRAALAAERRAQEKIREEKAKEERAREEKKVQATPESESKEAHPPGKNFEVLRRSSAATAEGVKEDLERAAATEAKEQPESKRSERLERRPERPASRVPDNWRARGPPKEPKSDVGEGDGWSTVSSKRGRGSNGNRVAPAS